jgi:hypothetical protein
MPKVVLHALMLLMDLEHSNQNATTKISNAYLGMITTALFTKLTDIPNNISLPERHQFRLLQLCF